MPTVSLQPQAQRRISVRQYRSWPFQLRAILLWYNIPSYWWRLVAVGPRSPTYTHPHMFPVGVMVGGGGRRWEVSWDNWRTSATLVQCSHLTAVFSVGPAKWISRPFLSKTSERWGCWGGRGPKYLHLVERNLDMGPPAKFFPGINVSLPSLALSNFWVPPLPLENLPSGS